MVQTKARPYWHVDAKWICGLLFFFSLGLALLLHTAMNLTREDRAIEIGAIGFASAFSPDGLDAPQDLMLLKQRLAASPTKTIAPIPSFPSVIVSEQDITALSPRELRLKTFRQISTPIYYKGVAGAAKDFTTDPELQKEFEKEASLLQFFTRQTHQQLTQFFVIATVITCLLLAPLVYFSWGWARLGNLGFLLAIVSLPGTLAGLIITNPPKGQDPNSSVLGFMTPEIASQLGQLLGQTYTPVIIAGLLLLLAAGVGKIVTTLRYRQIASDPLANQEIKKRP